LAEPTPTGSGAASGSSWGLVQPLTKPKHRMLGTYPKPPPRQYFKPPAGWVKPSKPVASWYDKGERLTSEASFVPGEPSGWGIVPKAAPKQEAATKDASVVAV